MGIIEQIKKGEGKTIEFKQVMPSAEKLSKTVVSFANMAGGKMIIGVTDDGKIVGIDNNEITSQMDRISNILHGSVHPMIIPEIYTYTVEEKTLLVIEVYPSQLKPHFLKNLGKADGTYIRVGATNKKADFEYIQELERQKLNISFDEDFALEQAEDFDFNSLKIKLEENLNRKIVEKDLINLKLLKAFGDRLKPTNAAFILQGQFEYVQIKCARFKGDKMDIFIDRKEYTGNIFDQLENAMKFLLSNINLHGEVGKDFITRVDEYEIPPEALREAILNAIIHRDYSMTGSDIKVAVFDSKIEITSPGCFPKAITIEEVLGGRSEIRNRVIVRIFKEAKKIEQWGRGVQRIIELCESKGLKRPEVLETGMFVKYIFYRESDDKLNNKSNEKKDDKSDDNLKISIYTSKVIAYLKENREIKISETMNLLNLSKSRSNDVLKSMQNRDIIIKQGSARATRYVLKETE
jgi:ATP-dependent DNA helicase RecG